MASEGTRFRSSLFEAYSRFAVLSRHRRRRLTDAGKLVAGLAGAAALVGLNTNIGTTYQLFTLLAALFLAAVLHGLMFRPRLQIERELPPYGSARETFRYRVRVRNLTGRKLFALRLTESVDDPIPSREGFLREEEPGEAERNAFDRTLLYYRWMWLARRLRLVRPQEGLPFDLAKNETAEVDMAIEPLRRGIVRLKEIAVARPDLFGLLYGIRYLATETEGTITVLPARYPVPRLALAGHTRYQTTASVLAGNVGHSDEFIGLRDYRAGDAMRHLHWRSWARTGRPIVREFEDEYFPRYALALDTFAACDHHDVFEEAVSVAASFVCTLDTKESLLDLLFIGTQAYCFTSGRGVSQPQHLLEVLAAVELCRNQPFAELDRMLRSRARDVTACICILLAWDDERRECIRRLRAYGGEMLVLVICPPDSTLPDNNSADGVRFIRTSEVAQELARL